MREKIKSIIPVLGLVASVIFTSGCIPLLIGAAAGAGGYAWVRGALVKQFDVSVTKLHAAALSGLRKNKLDIRYNKGDRLSATVRSEFSDGKNVGVDITAITEHSAQIKIRVGTFGDKLRSEMILSAIEADI